MVFELVLAQYIIDLKLANFQKMQISRPCSGSLYRLPAGRQVKYTIGITVGGDVKSKSGDLESQLGQPG